MRKELKKQIKEDDFASGAEKAFNWASAHSNELRVALVVAIVAAVGWAGLSAYMRQREQQAEQALLDAVRIMETPVASETPEGVERPAGPVYATAAEKYRKAVAAFDGMERRFPSSSLALRARLYAAECRVELGETEEARKALTTLTELRESRALEPALARLALADLDRRAGDIEKATKAYRQIAEDTISPLPKDLALMNLARLLEQTRKFDEARNAYRRITEEFPDSSFSSEARRRLGFLETADQS